MNERARSANDRGEAALKRVDELRDLLRRLKSGERLTQADLSLAVRRSDESQVYAADALTRARRAHLDAAQAHRSAAAAADLLGDSASALQHRDAATADETAAAG